MHEHLVLKGNMILVNTWYYGVLGCQGTNVSYMLLIDFGVAFAYSHLVVTSKFAMLPCARRKGELKFNIWC